MKKIILLIIFVFIIIAFFLAGCLKKDDLEGFVPVEEVSEVSEEPDDISEEETEAFTRGIVMFASGNVSVNNDESWVPLDVEDFVELDNRIKTESDSFCEIQFTDFGIIRIQGNTELLIGEVYLKEDQNKVNVNLKNGKILCKVNKITKGEEFQVRTSTALAGVRGTEFMVTARKDKSVHFAVKEGTVSVIPVSIADKIAEMKFNLKTETAKEILDEIAVPEIIITDEKEITIEQQEIVEAAQEFEDVAVFIEEKIKEIDEKTVAFEEKEKLAQTSDKELSDRDMQEIQEIKQVIISLKEEVISVSSEKTEEVEEVFKEPEAVSDTIEQELNEIEKMETKEFVIAVLIVPEKAKQEKKPAYTKVTIQVLPKDAKIYINDDSGIAKFSGLYLPDTELTIKVEREGYITKEKKIIVLDQEVQSVTIELKNSPVTWKLNIGSTPYIRKVVVSGNNIVIADAYGRVSCINTDGTNIWTVSTKNKPNNNSMPVVIGNVVLFSGSRELAILNLKSGKDIKRIPLGKGNFSSHLFGRRIVQFNENILYPSNNALLFLEPRTFNETSRIELSESSNSAPAVYNNNIIMVNQRGVLCKINPESGLIENRIESDALQPVGIAPVIRNDLAVFAGRDGTIVLTDLMKDENIWEKKIDIGKGTGIFQDVNIGDKAVYPYTGKQFYALSSENGEELYRPVSSTCPPMYYKGKLYFGDSRGQFILMNAETGKILKKYPLDSPITLQPAVYNGDIVVATKSGTIYRLIPKYM